jgi:hypothetical protein
VVCLLGLLASNVCCSPRTGPTEAVEIPFKVLASDKGSHGLQSTPSVARNEAEFQRIWVGSTPGSDYPQDVTSLPKVDFSRAIVVAFLYDSTPCDPYELIGVLEYPDKITAEFRHTGNECICSTIPAQWNIFFQISSGSSRKPIDYVIRSEPPVCMRQMGPQASSATPN